jgi:hypothetical protein
MNEKHTPYSSTDAAKTPQDQGDMTTEDACVVVQLIHDEKLMNIEIGSMTLR